ncbi:hypothetical protein FBQ85_05495 [Cytophagia bacterium CHB2]|nr:hypothetical protein [Cytophagia bacterium CHB2]
MKVEIAAKTLKRQQTLIKRNAGFDREPDIVFPENRHTPQTIVMLKGRGLGNFITQEIAVVSATVLFEEIEDRCAARHGMARHAFGLRIEPAQGAQHTLVTGNRGFIEIGMKADFEFGAGVAREASIMACCKNSTGEIVFAK